MYGLLQKLPFILELFINGSFVILYSLRKYGHIPESWNSELVDMVISFNSSLVVLVLFFVVIVNYTNCKSLEEFIRKHIFSLVVFFPLIISFGDEEFTFWLTSSHLLASVLTLYETGPSEKEKRKNKKLYAKPTSFISKLGLKPAQFVMITFVGLILLGTLFLMLPFSSKIGKPLGFVDALFMATSATCVTGLATKSLSSDLSLFGQFVILLLIQIGGLGFMTLSQSIYIFLGRSMGVKDKLVMQDLLDVSSQEGLLEMIMDIVKFTFLIELWGGIILTLAFSMDSSPIAHEDIFTIIYYGFFHSISAFCNAGFSLFTNSLEDFSTNLVVNFTICTLIILGGLGFIVLKDIRNAIVERKSIVRLALHTKIVLITTGGLIVGAALFIFFGEYLYGLDHYGLFDKIQISIFQSVTLRTAGFNTISLTTLNKYTLYVMTLLMFIGAAPGSTGGGIKVTTFAILIQSIKSTLKGRDVVEFFGRKIPNQLVVRVTALTIISLMITSSFIFIMMKLEPAQEFLAIFFEVVSASATVGLSLGITSSLTAAGKIAISLLMFIGRIGPLTLVLAIGQHSDAGAQFEYPEGRVMIG